MADRNHTTTDLRDGRPIKVRLDNAVEIVQELRERDNRVFALLSSILRYLEPDAEGNSPSITAKLLADVASDIVCDMDQSYRLEDLLCAARDEKALAVTV